MTNTEVIEFLMRKYGLSNYKFTSNLNINECGLCNGVFFDYKKDTLLVLNTTEATL